MLKHGFEFSRRTDPLTAREFVDFRCDDGRNIDGAFQPLPRLDVAREARVTRIDEEQRNQGWWGRYGW
jgi:hypothetical protein